MLPTACEVEEVIEKVSPPTTPLSMDSVITLGPMLRDVGSIFPVLISASTCHAMTASRAQQQVA